MNSISVDKNKFIAGVEKAVSLVSSTIGPAGSGVMEIGGGNLRRHFRDGFRVLELYQDENPEIREAVLRIRDVASNVAREAGDGTSTTTLLLGNAFVAVEDGMDSTDGQTSRADIVNAIDSMTSVVLEKLDEMVLPSVEPNGAPDLKVLKTVATISAAGDAKLGGMIAELIADVGTSGDVRVEQSYTGAVETEVVKGYVCDATCYDTSVFNTRRGVELGACNVVCIADTVSDFGTLTPVIQAWMRVSKLPLVFVVVDIEGTAQSTLLNPRDEHGNRAPLYLVRVPSAEVLEDVSKVVGTVVLSKTKGRLIRDFKEETLGRAQSMRFDLKQCSIVLDASNESNVESFCEYLRDGVENASHDEKAKVAARVGNLNGRVGIIRIPATTQTQGFFLHEVIDDCWRATMSALRDGVYPGGGMALLKCSDELERVFGAIEDVNVSIALNAMQISLESVSQAVCFNAGLNVDACVPDTGAVFDTFKIVPGKYDPNFGWVKAHVVKGNCLEIGVLDSRAALRSAVKNAFAELKMWVNTDFLIIHNPKK